MASIGEVAKELASRYSDPYNVYSDVASAVNPFTTMMTGGLNKLMPNPSKMVVRQDAADQPVKGETRYTFAPAVTSGLKSIPAKVAAGVANLGLKVYNDGYAYEQTPEKQHEVFANKVGTSMQQQVGKAPGSVMVLPGVNYVSQNSDADIAKRNAATGPEQKTELIMAPKPPGTYAGYTPSEAAPALTREMPSMGPGGGYMRIESDEKGRTLWSKPVATVSGEGGVSYGEGWKEATPGRKVINYDEKGNPHVGYIGGSVNTMPAEPQAQQGAPGGGFGLQMPQYESAGDYLPSTPGKHVATNLIMMNWAQNQAAEQNKREDKRAALGLKLTEMAQEAPGKAALANYHQALAAKAAYDASPEGRLEAARINQETKLLDRQLQLEMEAKKLESADAKEKRKADVERVASQAQKAGVSVDTALQAEAAGYPYGQEEKSGFLGTSLGSKERGMYTQPGGKGKKYVMGAPGVPEGYTLVPGKIHAKTGKQIYKNKEGKDVTL